MKYKCELSKPIVFLFWTHAHTHGNPQTQIKIENPTLQKRFHTK